MVIPGHVDILNLTDVAETGWLNLKPISSSWTKLYFPDPPEI